MYYANHYLELVSAGIPVRAALSAENFVSRLCQVLQEIGGSKSHSMETIVSHWATHKPLQPAWDELMDGPLPLSLEHGDLWIGNIIVNPDRIAVIDWADSSISHPFFSLARFVEYIHEFRDDVSSRALSRLKAAYLEPWTVYAPMTELKKQLNGAEMLFPVHRAARVLDTWSQTEKTCRWELSSTVLFYIRQMAKASHLLAE